MPPSAIVNENQAFFNQAKSPSLFSKMTQVWKLSWNLTVSFSAVFLMLAIFATSPISAISKILIISARSAFFAFLALSYHWLFRQFFAILAFGFFWIYSIFGFLLFWQFWQFCRFWHFLFLAPKVFVAVWASLASLALYGIFGRFGHTWPSWFFSHLALLVILANLAFWANRSTSPIEAIWAGHFWHSSYYGQFGLFPQSGHSVRFGYSSQYDHPCQFGRVVHWRQHLFFRELNWHLSDNPHVTWEEDFAFHFAKNMAQRKHEKQNKTLTQAVIFSGAFFLLK